MVDRYEVWVFLVMGSSQEKQVLYYHQHFCLAFEKKHFSLPVLFFQFLNQHDPFCIRVLLITVLIVQDGYYVFPLLNKLLKPYNLSVFKSSFIHITVR